MRKDVPFRWDQAYDLAFNHLKSAFIFAPILVCPDFTLPCELHTDASSTGIRFSLCQIQDGYGRALAYAGRYLTITERNYSTPKRVALAMVEAIKKFRSFSYDHKFTIHMNHNALKWLMSIKDPNGRLARWSL